MEKIYLSVIIPCYNEERNLRLGALENVAHFLSKKDYTYEVIVVDDGSTDESKKLINQFISDDPKFKLLSREHKGKAGTVIAGVKEAKGEYILFTDLDQATPMSQLDLFLPYFKKGFDLVIGSRNTKRRGAPLTRIAMARGFMILRNIILNLGVNDTQCGFKAFSKICAKNIFSKLKVFNLQNPVSGSTVTAGFDVELLYIAKLLGYKIAEVPVEWHYQETRNVSPIRDSLEGLIDLIKIRINSMNGVYNK
ncbi:glycosyltransferase [Candidatus Gottesmanbacteria bacterium]|nr:glycosyltransferase [Candidatus Gottesmanbacteria bacterium]